MAEAGWEQMAAMFEQAGAGMFTNPGGATMLLQNSGEFADPELKQRIWDAAEAHLEPTWDLDSGEFTLGLGLNEAHPRGQWNARMMAGWVCEPKAWWRIFNEPNLSKFDQPTVEGVDFPRIALSEARWDGDAMVLAAHPQNQQVANTRTRMRIANLPSGGQWQMTDAGGHQTALTRSSNSTEIEITANDQPVVIARQ